VLHFPPPDTVHSLFSSINREMLLCYHQQFQRYCSHVIIIPLSLSYVCLSSLLLAIPAII
jgi:hypothetical protein